MIIALDKRCWGGRPPQPVAQTSGLPYQNSILHRVRRPLAVSTMRVRKCELDHESAHSLKGRPALSLRSRM
jgi:hypothetical protein